MPGNINRGRWRKGWRDHAVTIAINVALLGAVIFAVVTVLSDDSADDNPTDGSRVAADDTGTPPPATPTPPGVELVPVDYLAGHCYSWDQERPMAEADDVPCAGRHLFEAAGETTIWTDYPISAIYPTPDQWTTIIDRYCPDVVRDYLGYPLDPYGRFAAGGIHPLEPGWDRGERSVTCGVTASVHDATAGPLRFPPFDGGARGTDQAWVAPIGSCFRDKADSVVPTSCDAPHSMQSIGAVTVPEAPGKVPPSTAWIDEQIEPRCRELAAPYLGVGRFGSAVVAPRWHALAQASWQAGTRTTTCHIGFVDQAGTPATVTGVMPAPAG